MFEVIKWPEDMKPAARRFTSPTSMNLQSVEYNTFIGLVLNLLMGQLLGNLGQPT